jgi:Kef-type K+ transport system membrane component KefB
MLLLILLLALAGTFGLDVVLGAFIAGIIVRRFSPPSEESLLQGKIEAIGFGFLIPLFFVVSGANLDIVSIIENPAPMLRFFAYILVARGLVQYVVYRNAIPDRRERARFSLLVATGLPIIVAVTSIEVEAGVMLPSNAAALVGAGALTVLVFPLVGDRLVRGRRTSAPDQERAENTV